MTTELVLVDTNVLVYSFFRDHPLYPASAHPTDHAQASEAGLCVVPQVLAEFYAIKDFTPFPELEVLEPPHPPKPEVVTNRADL